MQIEVVEEREIKGHYLEFGVKTLEILLENFYVGEKMENGEVWWWSQDLSVGNMEVYLRSSMMWAIIKIQEKRWNSSKVNRLIKEALEGNLPQ